MTSAAMAHARKAPYAIAGSLLVLYLAFWVALSALFEPNLQFYSYYAINYDDGFVRRGLAGEILDLFPVDFYFTGLLILRWLVPALFIIAIAAVAWTVAARSGHSDRRVMLAVLIPLLPFGVARAVVLPTPELLGAAALALFAVAITVSASDRGHLIASGIYGATTGLLALIHEAIPFLNALGAVLAIVVLTRSARRFQRNYALLALGPGIATGLTIALLGRRDVSAQCARLPHRAVDFPIRLSPSQVLNGEHAYTDYHDWTCRFITVTTRGTPISGINQIGWGPWVGSTVAGFAIFAVTMLAIRAISHVPFARFSDALQGRRSWVPLASLLLIPIFMTSSDWTRWWVAIAFDVGLVYLLYASQLPDSAQPATRRTWVSFWIAIVVMAVLPVLVGINAAQSAKALIANCDQLAEDPQWVGICP